MPRRDTYKIDSNNANKVKRQLLERYGTGFVFEDVERNSLEIKYWMTDAVTSFNTLLGGVAAQHHCRWAPCEQLFFRIEVPRVSTV